MRDQILDAVERLLVRDGVDAVRLDAVAREAGVSKGGLLHHFPSKRALVQGVVVRLADRFDAVLPEPGSPPGAFTLAWLDASIPEESPTGDRSGADHVPLALLAAAGGPDVLDVLRARYAIWRERLGADGIDPAVADLVRMAVDGWWTARLLDLGAPHDQAHIRLRALLTNMVGELGGAA
ncbi:TetR/AcrR family transcriptional regulator [Embleya sp. NBC_00896]|uniref:TetR/AcrR family transcriptional regulator n=1 Tax=Embleya sp. NBC_00896 TaxID=2975961 RepID=UPI00386A2C44|nr:TetR/AcrR family transcriptional regulator [Embleya sp. NBC_00896]